jgi:hypothetical protein
MKLMRMMVPLALVAGLVLAATATYAQCPMHGGGCGMTAGSCPMMDGDGKMMGKHKMGGEVVIMGPMSFQMVGGHSMMMKGNCMMMKDHPVATTDHPAATTGQHPMLRDHENATEAHWATLHGPGTWMGRCVMTRAMLRAKTRGLWAGEAVMASLPMGLMLGVTDESHHGDRNASVDVRGKGPDKSAGLTAKRMGPGLFRITGDLEGIDRVYVRVVTPGAGVQNVFFNLVPIMAHRGNHLMMMKDGMMGMHGDGMMN